MDVMILKCCGEHVGSLRESCWLNPEAWCLDSDYLYNLRCSHSSPTTAAAYSASGTVFWLALTSTYGRTTLNTGTKASFLFQHGLHICYSLVSLLLIPFHTHEPPKRSLNIQDLLKYVEVSLPYIYVIFSWWLTFFGFLTVLTWSHCFCSTQCLPTCYTAYLFTVIIAHFFHLE